MNFKLPGFFALSVILVSTSAALRAQTDGATPPPPPPPPPGAYSDGYYHGSVITTPPVDFVADVDMSYAFRFNNPGVVADVGGFWRNNFLGAEFAYYDANPDAFNWYAPSGAYVGRVRNVYDVDTLNLAYRYYIPIPIAAFDQNRTPLELYFGGAAGGAWTDLREGYYLAGYNGYGSHYNQAQFDANVVAGLQLNLTRHIGLRVGFRYIWISASNDNQSYAEPRLDSGALDAGLAFRF